MNLKYNIRNLFCALTMGLLFLCVSAQKSEAQVRYPVSANFYDGGIYSGFGWYPVNYGYWPWTYYSYPAYSPYGYSYYSYYNYQPYYATFATISYSPSTGKYGSAWGHYTQAAAVNASLNFCGVNDCSAVVWVQGGCAAIAVNSENENVSWGYHALKATAQSYALRSCSNAGGERCVIKAWACTY